MNNRTKLDSWQLLGFASLAVLMFFALRDLKVIYEVSPSTRFAIFGELVFVTVVFTLIAQAMFRRARRFDISQTSERLRRVLPQKALITLPSLPALPTFKRGDKGVQRLSLGAGSVKRTSRVDDDDLEYAELLDWQPEYGNKGISKNKWNAMPPQERLELARRHGHA